MPSSPNGCTASAEWSSRLGCSQLQNSSSASAPPLSAPTTLTSLSPTLTSLSPRMLPENALGRNRHVSGRKRALLEAGGGREEPRTSFRASAGTHRPFAARGRRVQDHRPRAEPARHPVAPRQTMAPRSGPAPPAHDGTAVLSRCALDKPQLATVLSCCLPRS